ncbi:MAG: hypothetical protein AAGI12_15740 [Pseudomonadota bacterium]
MADNLKYYHGGPNGLKEYILPPDVTGAKSLAQYSHLNFCDTSKVYVSTCPYTAALYASSKGDRVYEVVPEGTLLPDPDHLGDGVSFMCDRAKIKRVHRVAGRTRKLVRKALMDST